MESFVLHIFQEIGRETIAGIAAACGAAIAVLIHKLYTRWKENRKAKIHSVSRLNEIDIAVYKALAELLVSTSADRAYVVQFHNGMYYANSTGQLKMSCTHEMVRSGISREQRNMQDFLISRYPKMINEIITNPIVSVNTTDNECFYYTDVMKERGIGSCIISAIKHNGIIEGYVALDYLDELSNISSAASIYSESILNAASKIGFTLRTKD